MVESRSVTGRESGFRGVLHLGLSHPGNAIGAVSVGCRSAFRLAFSAWINARLEAGLQMLQVFPDQLRSFRSKQFRTHGGGTPRLALGAENGKPAENRQ